MEMNCIVNPLRAKPRGAASAVPAAFAPETPASRAAELAAAPAAVRAAARSPSAAFTAWHRYCAATGRPPPPPSVVLYAPYERPERAPPGRLSRWFSGAFSATPATLTVHILAPQPCAAGEEEEEEEAEEEEALDRIWARAPPGGTALPRAVQLDVASLLFADDSCALDVFDYAATTTLAVPARRLNVTLLCAEATTYSAKRAVRAALGIRGSDADCALLLAPGGVPLDARHCARRADFPSELWWVRRTPVQREVPAARSGAGGSAGGARVDPLEGAPALAPLPWQAKGEGGKLCELAYRAAVHAVISGRVPLTVAHAVALGAMQVLVERVTHLSTDTERRVRARAQWTRVAHGSGEARESASADGDDAAGVPPDPDRATFALLDAIAERLDAEAAEAEAEGDDRGALRAVWAGVAASEPLDFGGLGLVHRLRAVASVARPLALSRSVLRGYVPCFVVALLPRARARPWLALRRELEARVARLAHDELIETRASPRFFLSDAHIFGDAADAERALVAQHTNLAGLLYHVCRKTQRRYVAAARRFATAGFGGAVAALGSTQRALLVRAHRAGGDSQRTPCLLHLSVEGVAVSLHGQLFRRARPPPPPPRSVGAATSVRTAAVAPAAVRFVDLGPTQYQLSAAREVIPFADIARWRVDVERGTLLLELDAAHPAAIVAHGARGATVPVLAPASEPSAAQLGLPPGARTVTLLLDDVVATERLLRDLARRTVDTRELGGRLSLWPLETTA